MSLRPGPIFVVKLGGSLLDWPGWPARLLAFLQLQSRPATRPVLIVGGGRFADILRDLDRIHTLGEDRSHALALHVLDTTAHLAAALLPSSRVVTDLNDLPPTWAAGLLPILAPRHFLDRDDRRPDPLPHAWTTTTDSIAARVADRLMAAELVLLKSTSLPPQVANWQDAAALGLVDPEFARSVKKISLVRFVDLRNNDITDAGSLNAPASAKDRDERPDLLVRD